MKKVVIILILLLIGYVLFFIAEGGLKLTNHQKVLGQSIIKSTNNYWFLLQRKSNLEYLYKGLPGDKDRSQLIKIFKVKTGIPDQRPTPLPKLLGREYWLITSRVETPDSLETAPYFLTLDVPVSKDYPFGPQPYLECGGVQCDWVIPGNFGLHGDGGDPVNLSDGNPGSSGCIRHSSVDISYLYHILEPEKQQIRYYIEDI